MKCVFITDFMKKEKQGSQLLANAHYQTLCELCNENNVYVVAFGRNFEIKKGLRYLNIEMDDSLLGKILNILARRPFFCSKKMFVQIVEYVEDIKPDLIFFDNCCMGSIVKWCALHYPQIPRVVFCHGIYANSERQIMKRKPIKNKAKYFPVYNNILLNEKMSVLNSSAYVVLNERDNEMLKKYYGKESDFILPIYFEDTAKIKHTATSDNYFELLFVGSYFWPNIEGLKWFVINVMPFLNDNVVLKIVGRGMEKLEELSEFKSESIEILGEVEQLDDVYNSANLVIGPIFSGDGMKTKTAEAMMYGKVYLGTSEAFCGYEGMDEYCCETADEFIGKINDYYSFGTNKYDQKIKDVFLRKYSTEMAREKIKQVFRFIGVDE